MAQRARRMTIRAVLQTAVELEKRSMALYALFMRTFRRPDDLSRFWFDMARHEAGHCGALTLVECLLDMEPTRSANRIVSFDPHIVVRLRSLLTAYLREARSGVSLERAFEMVIDVEGSELEDVVVDLLQVGRDPLWHDQAIRLLIHELGDLSFMVEKFTRDEALLARADDLVERRVRRATRWRRARRVRGAVVRGKSKAAKAGGKKRGGAR